MESTFDRIINKCFSVLLTGIDIKNTKSLIWYVILMSIK
jgi:hypothetical protein